MTKTVFKVIVFAVAFAFVESSVVVYLRHLLGSQVTAETREVLFLVPGITFLEPQTAVKIITDTAILNVERIREATTLIMLGSVAVLAGKNFKEYLAYLFLAFGIWDIFYYVFLRLTIGWPQSLTDPDTFFLLPTPWVGPVFVPILVSSFLVLVSMFYLTKSKRT